jgi:hypothetical protein
VRWAGGEGGLGRLGHKRAQARERRLAAQGVRGLRRGGGEGSWAGGRKRERGEGKGISFFNSFQIHFFSNSQTSIKQETMHSNHDAQSLIILILFK